MNKIEKEEHILGTDIVISFKQRIALSDITGLKAKGDLMIIELNDGDEYIKFNYNDSDKMQEDIDFIKNTRKKL